MHIAFYHNIYPFGGGEQVTADIIQGLKEIEPEIKTSVIAQQIDADNSHRYRANTSELPALIARLRPDALIVGVDIPITLWHEIKVAAPQTKLVFLMHSYPLWQVTHKCGLSKVKRLREKLFHSYTKRYTKRYRQIQNIVDSFVTLCPEYAQKLALITGSPDKISSIYNPAHSLNIPRVDKQKEVLFMGRLSRPDKRVDRLLRIWREVAPKHPDWNLKIVGDGPDAEALQRMARNIPHVHFLGHSDDPAEHYATASIVCLTSDYEGWGLTLVEALSAGAIAMAFDCCAGVQEVLSDGRGILVKPYDEAEYAAALDWAMDGAFKPTDPQPFLTQLSPAHIAQKWLGLTNSLH